MLTWRKPQPGCEVPSASEGSDIRCKGLKSQCRDRADARQGLQAIAVSAHSARSKILSQRIRRDVEGVVAVGGALELSAQDDLDAVGSYEVGRSCPSSAGAGPDPTINPWDQTASQATVAVRLPVSATKQSNEKGPSQGLAYD